MLSSRKDLDVVAIGAAAVDLIARVKNLLNWIK